MFFLKEEHYALPSGNHFSDLFHCRLVLSFLQIQSYGVYDHFWFLLLSMCVTECVSKFSLFIAVQYIMTNLDSIFKSRGITFPTKVCLVKAMVFFPVVMYGCESWTIKKAECRRIDAFVQWCWRRLLRVPWTARRSNQSILKEISRECSLEGLMLKLKLQFFGHLMQRADSLKKTLMLGGIGGRKRRG